MNVLLMHATCQFKFLIGKMTLSQHCKVITNDVACENNIQYIYLGSRLVVQKQQHKLFLYENISIPHDLNILSNLVSKLPTAINCADGIIGNSPDHLEAISWFDFLKGILPQKYGGKKTLMKTLHMGSWSLDIFFLILWNWYKLNKYQIFYCTNMINHIWNYELCNFLINCFRISPLYI